MRKHPPVFWIVPLAVLIALLAAVGVALAQEATPLAISDDQVNAIAKQLYCPVCENVPLDVCPTQACAQWRDVIRQKLSEGWSEQQIKDYFAQQYGVRVLATPPAKGFNWLVYVIPPVGIIAGIFVLYRVFKAWKQPAGQPILEGAGMEGKAEAGIPDEYIQRIEEELRKKK